MSENRVIGELAAERLEALELVVSKIKSGQVTGYVVAAVGPDGAYITQATISPVELVGTITVLTHQLCQMTAQAITGPSDWGSMQ